MAGSSFDEVIRLSVEATDGGSVSSLASAIGSLEGVSDEARRNLQGLVQELADTQRLQAAAASYDRIVQAQQALASSITSLNQAQVAAAAADAAAQRELQHRTSTLAQAQIAQQAYLTSTQRSVAGEAQYAAAVRAAAQAQTAAQTAATGTATALTASNQALQRATTQQAGYNSQSARLASTLNTAGVSTTNLAASQAQLAQRAQATSTQLQAQTRSAQTAAPAFASLGVKLTAVAAAAAAAAAAFGGLKKLEEFGAESFKSAAAVEDSLARVVAVVVDAKQNLEELDKTITSAALSTGSSTEQAAAAMAAFAETGRTSADSITALVPILQLARVATIEVAQAAGIVDDALDQFGLSAGDAAEVVDTLVKASGGSQDALNGMASAMGKLAPAAKDAGLSFKDTATLLGFFAQNGLKAETAGKSLETVFRDLKNPASNLRTELSGLGTHTEDFKTAVASLTAGTEQSKTAFDSLDKASQRVISAFATQGPAAFEAFKQSVQSSAGAAKSFVDTLDETANGGIKRFGNAFSTLGEELAKPILEPLGKELNRLADKLTAFLQSGDLDKIKDDLKTTFEEAAKAVGTFIDSIDWEKLVTDAQTSVNSVSTSLSNLGTDLEKVAGILGTLASSVSLLFTLFVGAFNLLKTVISAMVVAAVQAKLTFAEMVDTVRGTHSEITLILRDIRDRALEESKKGLEGLSANLGSLVTDAQALSESLAKMSKGADGAGQAAEGAAAGVAKLGEESKKTRFPLNDLAGIGATFSEKFKGVKEGVYDAAGGVADFGDQCRRTAPSVGELKKASADAHAEVKRLADAGDSVSPAFQAASAAAVAADRAVANFGASAGRSSTSAADLRAYLDNLGGSSQSLGKNLETASTKLDEVAAAFQSGNLKVEDLRTAFDAYKSALLDSVKNSDQWAQSNAENIIRVKQAMLGLADIKPPLKPANDSIKETTQNTQQLTQTTEEHGKASVKTASQVEKAAAAAEKISAAAEEGRGVIKGFSFSMAQFGQAAVQAFSDAQAAALKFGIYNEADLNQYADRINFANARITAQFNDQKRAAAELQASLEGFSESQLQNLNLSDAAYRRLADGTRIAADGLTFLNQSDLGAAIGAAQALADKIDAVAEKAQSARAAFADFTANAKQQLADLNGDVQLSEKLRYDAEVERLRAQAEASGAASSQEFSEALAAANEIHQVKLRNIKEAADAQKKADEESAARQRESDAAAKSSQSSSSGSSGSGGTSQSSSKTDINVNLNGQNLGRIDPNDTKSIEALVRQLLPSLIRQIQAAARNSP